MMFRRRSVDQEGGWSPGIPLGLFSKITHVLVTCSRDVRVSPVRCPGGLSNGVSPALGGSRRYMKSRDPPGNLSDARGRGNVLAQEV